MHSDEAQREIRELESLRAQTNVWRTGLTGVFLAVTAVSVLVMWSSLTGLTKDGPQKEKFVSYLSSDLQSSVVPAAEQIGADALHNVNFGQEISNLNKRTPEVADATIAQFKLLAKDLPDRSERTLDSQFDTILREHKDRLKAAFPNATDEQLATLMMNITTEAHTQVASLADNMFSPHINSLNAIVTDLGTIESKEAPSLKGETPTWQMAFMVSDLARTDFADLQAQADADARAAQSPVAMPPKAHHKN